MEFYLNRLRKSQGEDPIDWYCSHYLEEKMAIVFSSIDFVKENLDPFEPYPAISLFFPTPNPPELFENIEGDLKRLQDIIIREELCSKESEFSLFRTKKYAGHTYLQIKFPDTSGGAIQPAIGYCGPYVVFTTHSSFLKELIDVNDGIGTSLSLTPIFSRTMAPLPSSHSLQLYLDSYQTIHTLQTLRSEIWRWICSTSKGGNIWQLRSSFEEFFSTLETLKPWKMGVGISLVPARGKISFNLSLPLSIR